MRWWRHNPWTQRLRELFQHYLPLLLGTIATISVLVTWQHLLKYEQLHTHQLVQQEAVAIETELGRELSTRILALEQMANRWQFKGGTPKADWETDAAQYIEDFSGYQAIEWVDPSFHVRWVVPAESNEAAQNFDLGWESRCQITLSLARDLHQTLLTRTITLVQGGKGMLVVVPLFVKDHSGNPTVDSPTETIHKRFDGFIVGVFQFQSLFDRILTTSPQYQIQIFDRNGVIYSQGAPLTQEKPGIGIVQSYGVDWQVQVFPTPKFAAAGRSLLPDFILWGGLLGSWILAFTVSLKQQATQQVQQTRRINQQLQDEILHRQQIEASLQQLVSHINAGLVVHALDTHILRCNTTACELLGLSMDQMLGKVAIDPAWHFVREDGTPMPIEEYPINLVLSTQASLNSYVLGINREDQSRVWVMVTAFPEFDANQQIQQVVVTFIDISQLKQVERNLQEMTAAMENAISGISRIDTQGHYLYVNKVYADMTGYQAEEMIGMDWQQTVHPDDLKLATNAYQQMLQDGKVEVEAKGICKDSSIVYKQLVMIATYNEQQQLVGHYCFAKDISDRKQTEAALRQSEVTKKAIIEAIPDLLMRMHSDGSYIEFISNSHFNIINPAQFRQDATVYDVLPSHLAQLRMHYTHLALEYNTTQIYEQGIVIEGQQRYEEVRIVPLQADEVLVMVRDITDRQQAEENLLHQKEMFQAIVDHIPVMIALFDRNGCIEFVNPELEHVLGWSLKEWQHQDILALCYPDTDYCQSIKEFMLAATGRWQDMMTFTAFGQSLETSWANVKLSSGRFLGIGQDISDRKRKEAALKQAMEAAEAANLAKSIFLANMSHELRTPLNVILGFVQVMAHDMSLTSSQHEDLQTIRRSGDYLLSLINDVLDLSKIEAGHALLEETGFDLISLLHTLRSMMAERATTKQLQLTFDIAPDVPQFVIADEQKLRQILLNLISNAIKFTNQGSIKLQVSLNNQWSEWSEIQNQGDQQRCSLRLCSPNSQSPHPVNLRFEVIDTGVGIAENEQKNIFDAFVQAEAGRKSVSGTGLGLTISCKLVELMHGTISVQSVPNIGSTFIVNIPVCPTSSIHIQTQPSNRTIIGLAPKQPQHRILIVDDQQENRLLMVRLLTQLGLEVREATNGQEAVQIWQNWQPDLTWMDIRMPGMDGYEATRQIRAMEQDKASIIIALTAQASQSDRALALAAGCNDYISKPFREETLFLKLQEYLGLEYLYADSETSSSAPSLLSSDLNTENLESFDPNLLTQLSPGWLDNLEDLALCGNDRAIVALATELPPEFETFKAHLVNLANRFEFEKIVQLIRLGSSP